MNVLPPTIEAPAIRIFLDVDMAFSGPVEKFLEPARKIRDSIFGCCCFASFTDQTQRLIIFDHCMVLRPDRKTVGPCPGPSPRMRGAAQRRPSYGAATESEERPIGSRSLKKHTQAERGAAGLQTD